MPLWSVTPRRDRPTLHTPGRSCQCTGSNFPTASQELEAILEFLDLCRTQNSGTDAVVGETLA
jgi:hypothetical protein